MSLPYQDTIVTYTGRLSKEKGLELLLEVWKRVVVDYPNTYLLLVGSGSGQAFSSETELRAFVANNDLSDRVGFTGYVENVHVYLQASDIFVLPSETEGFGLALIEALACKLPSVATKVGGILDIIIDGKNGLLGEPKDPEGLYNAIRWLFNNRAAAASLGEWGRFTVQERFSIDAVVDRHLMLFLSLYRKSKTEQGLQVFNITDVRMDVSIVIVSYNTVDLLRNCLNSIYAETRKVDFEVFVVDNASSDGSVQMVENDFPDVRLIKNPKNIGFAKANNQAMELCTGQYVLLLNPDTLILNGAISKMTTFMDQNPHVGLACCKLLNPDGTLQINCRKLPLLVYKI
ncbi:glycosyltransferase, partial [bacterium]|nr:glycosyltransferase [bacterium]